MEARFVHDYRVCEVLEPAAVTLRLTGDRRLAVGD
jgi:hypothetical protein